MSGAGNKFKPKAKSSAVADDPYQSDARGARRGRGRGRGYVPQRIFYVNNYLENK